jgi:hypothetical protein
MPSGLSPNNAEGGDKWYDYADELSATLSALS